MELDAAIIGVVISVILVLVGFGVAWGAIFERVKGHQAQIRTIAETARQDRMENKQDHRDILDKIDEIPQRIIDSSR